MSVTVWDWLPENPFLIDDVISVLFFMQAGIRSFCMCTGFFKMTIEIVVYETYGVYTPRHVVYCEFSRWRLFQTLNIDKLHWFFCLRIGIITVMVLHRMILRICTREENGLDMKVCPVIIHIIFKI